MILSNGIWHQVLRLLRFLTFFKIYFWKNICNTVLYFLVEQLKYNIMLLCTIIKIKVINNRYVRTVWFFWTLHSIAPTRNPRLQYYKKKKKEICIHNYYISFVKLVISCCNHLNNIRLCWSFSIVINFKVQIFVLK